MEIVYLVLIVGILVCFELFPQLSYSCNLRSPSRGLGCEAHSCWWVDGPSFTGRRSYFSNWCFPILGSGSGSRAGWKACPSSELHLSKISSNSPNSSSLAFHSKSSYQTNSSSQYSFANWVNQLITSTTANHSTNSSSKVYPGTHLRGYFVLISVSSVESKGSPVQVDLFWCVGTPYFLLYFVIGLRGLREVNGDMDTKLVRRIVAWEFGFPEIWGCLVRRGLLLVHSKFLIDQIEI